MRCACSRSPAAARRARPRVPWRRAVRRPRRSAAPGAAGPRPSASAVPPGSDSRTPVRRRWRRYPCTVVALRAMDRPGEAPGPEVGEIAAQRSVVGRRRARSRRVGPGRRIPRRRAGRRRACARCCPASDDAKPSVAHRVTVIGVTVMLVHPACATFRKIYLSHAPGPSSQGPGAMSVTPGAARSSGSAWRRQSGTSARTPPAAIARGA